MPEIVFNLLLSHWSWSYAPHDLILIHLVLVDTTPTPCTQFEPYFFALHTQDSPRITLLKHPVPSRPDVALTYEHHEGDVGHIQTSKQLVAVHQHLQ